MREKIFKAILCFFVVMACCTLIARGADSMTIAKVQTGKLKSGSLVVTLEGSGGIQSKDHVFKSMPEGQKIARILVKAGNEVEVGQEIVQLDKEYLKEQIREQKRAVRKARLQLEQQKLDSQSAARIPVTAQAGIALAAAETAVNSARAVYDQAMEAYNSHFGKEKKGWNDEKRQAYEQQEEALKAAADAACEGVEAAEAAYAQELDNYQLAVLEEENTQKNEAVQQESARLSFQNLQMELDSQKEKLKKLKKIKKTGAVIRAQSKGTLESLDVKEGVITTGTEQIVLAAGGLEACGTLPEDGIGKIETGDPVEVWISGKTKSVELTVERMEQDQEGNLAWFAPVEDAGYRMGTALTYKYSKESVNEYEKIIPLTALRESQGSTHVLIAEVRPGILGDSYEAVKMSVTVLEKDDNQAAVQASLTRDSLIITESNKYVKEGDRIRISE